jgi:hypothetical protein
METITSMSIKLSELRSIQLDLKSFAKERQLRDEIAALKAKSEA